MDQGTRHLRERIERLLLVQEAVAENAPIVETFKERQLEFEMERLRTEIAPMAQALVQKDVFPLFPCKVNGEQVRFITVTKASEGDYKVTISKNGSNLDCRTVGDVTFALLTLRGDVITLSARIETAEDQRAWKKNWLVLATGRLPSEGTLEVEPFVSSPLLKKVMHFFKDRRKVGTLGDVTDIESLHKIAKRLSETLDKTLETLEREQEALVFEARRRGLSADLLKQLPPPSR